MHYLKLSEPDNVAALKQALAQNITARRKKLKISQAQLAERSGLSPTHVSHLSCGNSNPTLGTLAILAEALDITVVELLSP